MTQQVLTMIEAIPEADILERGRFRWTGRWILADYIAGNTGSHYAWAKTKIGKWIKERKANRS